MLSKVNQGQATMQDAESFSDRLKMVDHQERKRLNRSVSGWSGNNSALRTKEQKSSQSRAESKADDVEEDHHTSTLKQQNPLLTELQDLFLEVYDEFDKISRTHIGKIKALIKAKS